MAKPQFTNRQKNITRLIRDRRDAQRAKIEIKKGKPQGRPKGDVPGFIFRHSGSASAEK